MTFFDEYFLLDLLVRDGVCCGVVAMCLERGDLHVFHAKAVLFATGGFGRMYKITSNALSFTGDGPAVAFRRGVPLEDMEFFQFHPTGIYKLGILISEAVRGEGGILRNGTGERFMERYAPTLLDLAPRDIDLPRDLPGNPRGARRGRKGLRPPRRHAHRPRDAPGQAARHQLVRADLPRH